MLGFLSFLTVVIGARSAAAPFIKPCAPGDTTCYIASAQAAVPFIAPGVPALAVKSLDPLFLKEIRSEESGLKLRLKDTTVKGMKGCIVENLKHDVAKGKQAIAIRCSVKLDGDYTLDGRILLLPIKGEGKHHIDINDIIIKTATDIEVVKGDDGKDHWHIKSWKHSFQTKTGAKFDFKNLFNGNKLLADPVTEFVNSNWAEVMKEIAPPIVHAIVENVVEAVEALYKAVPADELQLA